MACSKLETLFCNEEFLVKVLDWWEYPVSLLETGYKADFSFLAEGYKPRLKPNVL